MNSRAVTILEPKFPRRFTVPRLARANKGRTARMSRPGRIPATWAISLARPSEARNPSQQAITPGVVIAPSRYAHSISQDPDRSAFPANRKQMEWAPNPSPTQSQTGWLAAASISLGPLPQSEPCFGVFSAHACCDARFRHPRNSPSGLAKTDRRRIEESKSQFRRESSYLPRARRY